MKAAHVIYLNVFTFIFSHLLRSKGTNSSFSLSVCSALIPTNSQLFSSGLHLELRPSEHLQVESSIWLPLNVVSNGNASSSSQAVGVTKIAKSVIAPLAQQHVSVFMLSTYQTDFILVSLNFNTTPLSFIINICGAF